MVEMASGATIASVNCFCAFAPRESVTSIVNDAIAAGPLGVPASTPVAVSERPAGRAPAVTAYPYGARPPAEAIDWLGYATPMTPRGSGDGVVIAGVLLDTAVKVAEIETFVDGVMVQVDAVPHPPPL